MKTMLIIVGVMLLVTLSVLMLPVEGLKVNATLEDDVFLKSNQQANNTDGLGLAVSGKNARFISYMKFLIPNTVDFKNITNITLNMYVESIAESPLNHVYGYTNNSNYTWEESTVTWGSSEGLPKFLTADPNGTVDIKRVDSYSPTVTGAWVQRTINNTNAINNLTDFKLITNNTQLYTTFIIYSTSNNADVTYYEDSENTSYSPYLEIDYNQTAVTNCEAGDPFLNITLHDEATKDNITGDVSITFNITSNFIDYYETSFILNASHNFTFCSGSDKIIYTDSVIEYTNSTSSTRYYYLINATFDPSVFLTCTWTLLESPFDKMNNSSCSVVDGSNVALIR